MPVACCCEDATPAEASSPLSGTQAGLLRVSPGTEASPQPPVVWALACAAGNTSPLPPAPDQSQSCLEKQALGGLLGPRVQNASSWSELLTTGKKLPPGLLELGWLDTDKRNEIRRI